MNVIGPNWPSTRALRAALSEAEGADLHWGSTGMNKLDQLCLLQESVNVPTFTTDLTTAREWMAGCRIQTIPSGSYITLLDMKTMLGRSLHHSQGRDIRLPDHPRWSRSAYWTEYIPSVAEYRAHVWGRRVFRIGRKLRASPASITPNPPSGGILIRSARIGWELRYGGLADALTDERKEEIRALARASVAACSYEYGAVDVLEGNDGRLYTLEVNTAPALGPFTLAGYVKEILRSRS